MSQPDLRAMQKNDSFHCGSDVAFTAIARSTISILCFDCGKCFKTPKQKAAHVASIHQSGDTRRTQECTTCRYKHKDPNNHRIEVKRTLQVPNYYPAGIQHDEEQEQQEADAANDGDEPADGEA